MKIVLLTGMYPPAGGGAERATALLAQGLRALGHEPHVVTTARTAGDDTVEGVSVHRIAARRAWIGDVLAQSSAARVRWNLAELADRRQTAAVIDRVRALRPELIITANIKGLGGLLPRALRRLPQPHLHVAHDFEPVEPRLLRPGQRADRLGNRVWALVSRLRWGNPEAVVFPSAWLQKLIGAQHVFSGSRQAVIPNPVDVAAVGARIPRPGGEYPPLHGGPFRMLFIGQLEPHKGARWAAETLVGAYCDTPLPTEWTLDIVGDGADRGALDTLAARDTRIRVHGPLDGAAKEERWQHADALLVPSRCLENAPLVVFEAAARRVPVVAADVGGVPEYVISGETGWRFASGDVTAFLFAAQTAADPARRSALRWQKLPPLLAPAEYARQVLALVGSTTLGPPLARGGNGGVLDLLPKNLSAFKQEEAHYHDHATHDAADVHQLNALRNRFYHQRIFRHLRPVAPGGWLLELAGGSGEDAAEALALGLRVVETDISKGAVEDAARLLSAVPESAGRFVTATMDAERIPVADGAFAGAWMTASLHHAEDPRVVLREVRRSLAPGARFVAAVEPHRLYFGAINMLKPLFELVLGKRTDMSVADEEHSGFWHGELRALFIKSDFTDVRVEPMWFTAGFLHYTLEFLTRLLKKKKRLAAPLWLEKACAYFDEFVFRLPGGRYLAWHWVASGQKPNTDR
ncbi:glycosyltransferase [Patescibacteria group bacterium]|nr:MAG: glycosyltransferase [Patescibacteria group bacterium]